MRSRTVTAVAGLLVSLLISAAVYWYTNSLLVFLFVPFVPFLFRGASGAGGAGGETEPSPERECPRCGFRTRDPSHGYCPRDGTRLEDAGR
jgi:hypothetical protein